MTVISTHKDVQALNFTIVVELDAEVERVWQIWSDPRQLERWWGPPTFPATFEQHDFHPGGKAAYCMTGPEGEKARGWWRFTAIQEPNRLEFEDGFADDNGDPVDAMGLTRCTVTLEAFDGGTRMTTISEFESIEQLEKMVEMGMAEGMTEAMGQIDAILAGAPA